MPARRAAASERPQPGRQTRRAGARAPDATAWSRAPDATGYSPDSETGYSPYSARLFSARVAHGWSYSGKYSFTWSSVAEAAL